MYNNVTPEELGNKEEQLGQHAGKHCYRFLFNPLVSEAGNRRNSMLNKGVVWIDISMIILKWMEERPTTYEVTSCVCLFCRVARVNKFES